MMLLKELLSDDAFVTEEHFSLPGYFRFVHQIQAATRWCGHGSQKAPEVLHQSG